MDNTKNNIPKAILNQLSYVNNQLDATQKVLADSPRMRIIGLFKRNPYFINTICNYHHIPIHTLEGNEDKCYWKSLSRNKSLPWSIELIEKYADKWNWSWNGLVSNESLPWSIELIEKFEDKWQWDGYEGLSNSGNIPSAVSALTKS